MNVNNRCHTFSDLFFNNNPGKIFDIYVEIVCSLKTSYWIGPLLMSLESYYAPYSNNINITTCSKLITIQGSGILQINPETGKFISLKGNAGVISGGILDIYEGIGTSGKHFGSYNGYSAIPLLVSTIGPLTIIYNQVYSPYQLTVGCIINTISLYNTIINNDCRKISCDNNWRNVQNKIVQDTGECVTDCKTTSNKFEYRGKCYNICPENTSNINYICYSNSTLEKCQIYSNESEYEDLCIKCNNNYYPMLNDKSNKNDFINCYKNNSLDK